MGAPQGDERERRSILWIDDDPETVLGPTAWLKHLGNEVVFVESSQEAADCLRDKHFDLLLVDERLSPEGNSGAELVHRLRAGDLGIQNAAAPFAFVTAFAGEVDSDSFASAEGFLGVINKANDLPKAIGEALEQLVTLPGLVDLAGNALSSEDPRAESLGVRFKKTEKEVWARLAEDPSLMHHLHHREFEELIAELFDRNGFEVVLTASTHDGGADLYAVLDTNLGEFRFAVDGVKTKRLVEQVKRNLSRFPEDFMFQLTKEEAAALRSQIATSNNGRGGRRYTPMSLRSREWQCCRASCIAIGPSP